MRNRITTFTLTAALLLVGAGKVLAGHGCCGGHGKMDADQKLEKMSKKLNLTDDQKGKIRPILEAQMSKMESNHKEMAASMEETRSQIASVLTDEQKKKFEKMSLEKMKGSDACCASGAMQKKKDK